MHHSLLISLYAIHHIAAFKILWTIKLFIITATLRLSIWLDFVTKLNKDAYKQITWQINKLCYSRTVGASLRQQASSGPVSESRSEHKYRGVAAHFTDTEESPPRPRGPSLWPHRWADGLYCLWPAGQHGMSPAAARCPQSPPWPRHAAAWCRCSGPSRWEPLRGSVTLEPPACCPSSSPSSDK